MTTHPGQIDVWLDHLPADRRDEAVQLADQVRAAAPELDEAIKWNRLTFTAGGDWHHWVCAVAATKRAVSLSFHKGSLLDDPDGLLTGDGQYLRGVSHARAHAEPAAVAALVRQAVARQKDMLPG
ncbi:DUF1801 domain-containing protein [Jiangella anatolica]|uniref:YdhG-like domain-containing protein n=1 Tax=Jiangella anatolica TaxID=2670374 RepID=A0A2W2C5G4_9ACTN|nr:DUF1801 domain-containing protein [Jiangella anatolica]PZF80966.1 hypothetical protein C1I92_23295 [Jiangella anatolica]